MTYFIGKHSDLGRMRIVTKVPRMGNLEVVSEAIQDDYRGTFSPEKFRWARKFVTMSAAKNALEAVHYAGFEEYTIMERGDI